MSTQPRRPLPRDLATLSRWVEGELAAALPADWRLAADQPSSGDALSAVETELDAEDLLVLGDDDDPGTLAVSGRVCLRWRLAPLQQLGPGEVDHSFEIAAGGELFLLSHGNSDAGALQITSVAQNVMVIRRADLEQSGLRLAIVVRELLRRLQADRWGLT